MSEELLRAAALWVDLNPRQAAVLASIFQRQEFSTHDWVTVPDQRPHRIDFIARGLVRYFYLEDNATESDRLFADRGTFVRALGAASLGIPYGARALEASTVYSAPVEALTALFDSDPVFERFARRLGESMLLQKERHSWTLQHLSAIERYRDFLERFPHLTGRVPQYHVASYLGMAEVSLSRIKKSLTLSNSSRVPPRRHPTRRT